MDDIKKKSDEVGWERKWDNNLDEGNIIIKRVKDDKQTETAIKKINLFIHNLAVNPGHL